MDTTCKAIKLLPQSVVDKIAAGEVIERPTSVVKELVENALDAGAGKISVFLEDAGFARIRVVDDGHGIPPADLPLALAPHATSKLLSADDLFRITTMGFRGEALASVASVSRLSIVSSSTTSGLGHSIRSDGGVISPITPVASPRGTTVEVAEIFFNTPARKKFMKSAKSEKMAAIRAIQDIAPAFPHVHFTLFCEGTLVFDIPRVESLLDRIGQINGRATAAELIECVAERESLNIRVLISPPSPSAARPRFQNLYVNLRRVDCDSVLYAIREAYGRFIGEGRKPSFYAFIDIDPTSIDVNVHPTKKTIKFEDDRAMFSAVFHCVKDALTARVDFTPDQMHRAEPIPPPPFARSGHPATAGLNPRNNSYATDGLQSIHFGEPPAPAVAEPPLESSYAPTLELGSSGSGPGSGLIECYQIHELFILVQIKNGILLIDQHIAHERILFEKALDDLRDGLAESQQMLFPVVVELSATEKAVLESSREYFKKFGFALDHFGGQAVSVQARPPFLKDSEIEPAIRSMIDYLLDEKNTQYISEPHKRFAAAFSCGAAIKAGQRLNKEEMNALINSLFSTRDPYTCPHGRPVVVRISLDELSRRFLR